MAKPPPNLTPILTHYIGMYPMGKGPRTKQTIGQWGGGKGQKPRGRVMAGGVMAPPGVNQRPFGPDVVQRPPRGRM